MVTVIQTVELTAVEILLVRIQRLFPQHSFYIKEDLAGFYVLYMMEDRIPHAVETFVCGFYCALDMFCPEANKDVDNFIAMQIPDSVGPENLQHLMRESFEPTEIETKGETAVVTASVAVAERPNCGACAKRNTVLCMSCVRRKPG